ncbi:MAG TPA: hypothetical protein ENG62_02775 [Thermoplasmatales archaeon]|nr:hypothetical protein [Thermoplasmatales archaeon]
MQVAVRILRTNEVKTINLRNDATIIDLLDKLGFKPDTVIVTNGETPIPVDDQVKDNKELTIIQVSSGG